MTSPHSDPVGDFAEAMSGAGLPVPDNLVADGKLHRFSANGKSSDDAGWYVLHADGVVAGAFGDWRTGLSQTWSAQTPDQLDGDEAKRLRAKWREIQRKQKAARERRHKEAAERAREIWKGATPAPADHPYLVAKGVQPHGIRVDDDGVLVIPMQADGSLCSLQFIDENGGKLFLPGGRVSGTYYAIGKPGDTIVVCEGFATGASVYEAAGHAVAVALNAGNLKPVAESLREKYPDAELILAADNDVRHDGWENTGVAKATEAARAAAGRMVMPPEAGDFNDLHVAHGLDAVREAVAPGPPCSPSHEGEALLDEARDFIGQFCVFPDEHCLTAVTLWAAHTHMVQHFHISPRLALLSPEAGSGKTRVLEILELLTPDAQLQLNASPATIYRKLGDRMITLLFDEVDAIWSRKGKDDDNHDLRSLLNSGYKKGSTVPRCIPPNYEVIDFPTFCPVALAGLGDLPDTIMTRAFIIRMRRRAPDEPVSEFRSRRHTKPGNELRDRMALWAAQVGASVGDAEPDMPEGITDRPAEIWEPCVAIADAAGGHWPETARAACLHLCRVAEDRRASLGIRLLADLWTVFGDADALHTETILERLHNPEQWDLDDDAPWADLRGKPIADRGLAGLLKPYGIQSRKVREPGKPPKKGYRRDDLWDAWARYLPPLPEKGEQGEQGVQASVDAASGVPQPAPEGEQGEQGRVPHVPQGGTEGERQEPRHTGLVHDVPHVPHSRDGGEDDDEAEGWSCTLEL